MLRPFGLPEQGFDRAVRAAGALLEQALDAGEQPWIAETGALRRSGFLAPGMRQWLLGNRMDHTQAYHKTAAVREAETAMGRTLMINVASREVLTDTILRSLRKARAGRPITPSPPCPTSSKP